MLVAKVLQGLSSSSSGDLMPDFRVVPTADPALASIAWVDVASEQRPSRVLPVDDRIPRKLVVQPNSELTLTALMTMDTVPQFDTVVGRFNMWCIEHPGASPPMQWIPDEDMSAVQMFLLTTVGHYTFVVRHENTLDAPQANAGGAVIVHIDVEAVS